jgi:DNA-binding GntR family transcriptional regulator
LLRELGGPPVTGSEQTIRAVSLTAADAAELGVAAGSAALLIHAVGHSAEGPLWVEDTLYRGDRYCFQNSISGVRTARPARVAEFGAVPGGGVSE